MRAKPFIHLQFISILPFLLFLLFLLYSCTKSSGDEGGNPPPPNGGNNGGNNCDTADMKYTANVLPILQNNCYSCHGTSTNSGSMGIVLEGYDNIRPFAESGTLLNVITHANGFPPMPKDAAKLSDCNINKIRSWVNNGFQNN